MQAQASAAAGAGQDGAMKTSDAEAGTGQEESTQDSSAATSPEALMGIMASPAPSPAPSPEQPDGLPPASRADENQLAEYFAVITISGQLPDIITVNARADNGNGTYNIVVTVDIANQLVKDGYTSAMGNAEKTTALVVYTP